jgi:hypothetical protein
MTDFYVLYSINCSIYVLDAKSHLINNKDNLDCLLPISIDHRSIYK